jgi:hypothetical protein
MWPGVNVALSAINGVSQWLSYMLKACMPAGNGVKAAMSCINMKAFSACAEETNQALSKAKWHGESEEIS